MASSAQSAEIAFILEVCHVLVVDWRMLLQQHVSLFLAFVLKVWKVSIAQKTLLVERIRPAVSSEDVSVSYLLLLYQRTQF
jgi:hypothetical protein